MSPSRGRLIFLAVIWILSLAYYVECSFLPRFSEKITVALTFWIFTLLVVVEGGRQMRAYRADQKAGAVAPLNFTAWLGDKRVQLSLAVVAYVVLIPVVGFYAVSFLSFLAFSFILGTKRWSRIVLPGVIVLGAIYVTFTVLLKLTLPAGFLF